MNTMTNAKGVKVRAAFHGETKPGFRKYRDLCYGNVPLWQALKAELLFALMGSMAGAAGLYLRSKVYPTLFGSAGNGILIGKNVTFRHMKKIWMGNNVIIDDNCVIDAKGEDNNGIMIGDNVFIGRNTIVYCKNGDICLKQGVNISSFCTIFSSNSLTVMEYTMIGGYSYLLSGGEYNYGDRETKFVDQSGMRTRGELVVGRNCWLGARVTILDGASVGEHCVIGAGAVVNRPIPADSLAVGVPAKVIKSIQ